MAGPTGRGIPGRCLSVELVMAILKLDAEELYPPSAVARTIPVETPKEYQQWRKRCGDFIRYHCPDPEGKAGRWNAWTGTTWKEFLDPADEARARELMAIEDAKVAEINEPEPVETPEVHDNVVSIPVTAINKEPVILKGETARNWSKTLLPIAAALVLGWIGMNKMKTGATYDLSPTEMAEITQTTQPKLTSQEETPRLELPDFLNDQTQTAQVPALEAEDISITDFAAMITTDRKPFKLRYFRHNMRIKTLPNKDRHNAFASTVKPEQASFLLEQDQIATQNFF